MLSNATIAEHSQGRVTSNDPAMRPTLSEQLWDMAWDHVLPHHFEDGFSVVRSSYARSFDFIVEHYPTIFEESSDSPFKMYASSSKARYYELCDVFEFVRGGSTVGAMLSAPSDWSTYYMRSAGLVPSVQGSGVIKKFLTHVLFETLANAGVERVELDVSPANLAMVHLMTRMSFNVTGSILTERWGALTRFTKYLNSGCERVFVNQFCSGVKYQLRGAHERVAFDEKGNRS